MKTAEQIKTIIVDMYNIQHGAWPTDYVDAVLSDAESALQEYKLLLTVFERMSSKEKKVFLNTIYGMTAL